MKSRLIATLLAACIVLPVGMTGTQIAVHAAEHASDAAVEAVDVDAENMSETASEEITADESASAEVIEQDATVSDDCATETVAEETSAESEIAIDGTDDPVIEIEADAEMEEAYADAGYSGWKTENGKSYWYENGKRQGYDPGDKSYRGKEIYDPAQNAWFWLDNNAQGKKAVSKDVYQPYTYQGKDTIGKWVRYDSTGRMIKGWDQNSKGRYYFDPTTGAMRKGQVKIDGSSYYFDESTGVMAKGLVKVDGSWYYYDESTGALQTGDLAKRMTYAAEVVDLVNAERTKRGLNALTIDMTVMKAAMVRAEELNTQYSHTRPDGSRSFTILDAYGVQRMHAGENIAYGSSSPEAVMDCWMNSPSHRANILSSQFDAIGVGYIKLNGTRYWVQMFIGD